MTGPTPSAEEDQLLDGLWDDGKTGESTAVSKVKEWTSSVHFYIHVVNGTKHGEPLFQKAI